MFKTILAIATAALVLATIAPPAHAGIRKNGVEANGLTWNGLTWNGRSWQGTSTGATGFTIDGIELPAAR